MSLLLFGPLGGPEILIILLLCAVFFGAKKMPQLGTGLGMGIRNFKDAVTGADSKRIDKKAKKQTDDDDAGDD